MAENRNPIYASLADVEFESKNRPLVQMAQALERTIRAFIEREGKRECNTSN